MKATENKTQKKPTVKSTRSQKSSGTALPSFFYSREPDAFADSIFFDAFSDTEESVPLWWKMDIPEVRTARERKRALSRQAIRNAYIAKMLETEKTLNKRFAEKLKKDEEKLARLTAENEIIIEAKRKEMELTAEMNIQRLEREIMEKQAVLKEAERAALQAELDKNNDARLMALQKELEIKTSGLAETLNGLNSEIEEKIRVIGAQGSTPGVDYGIRKRYSQPSKSDAIEFIDVTFKERESVLPILLNVSFTVKRNAVTVVYSQSKEKLKFVRQIIYKNYSQDFHIISGLVRINAKEIAQYLKTDFNREIAKELVSLINITDEINGSSKRIKDLYKGRMSERNFATVAERFGISAQDTATKLKALDADTRSRMALCAALSMNDGIIILETPEDEYTQDIVKKLTDFIGKTVGKTVLLLTASLDAVSRTAGCGVYKI